MSRVVIRSSWERGLLNDGLNIGSKIKYYYEAQTASNSCNGSTNKDENEGKYSANSNRKFLENDWKAVSEKMQMDIETFSKGKLAGKEAGALNQNLREVNREKYDYSEFLKKFAVMGEVMQINDDEFDYIFYSYGMNMYGKMPLIEPLEYKEVKRVKEFVIAIDTSESTSGDLVQKFLNKTYNIMKQEENFFTKINVHIIQCDTEIQEHVKISSQEEFDEYINNITDLAPKKYRYTLVSKMQMYALNVCTWLTVLE